MAQERTEIGENTAEIAEGDLDRIEETITANMELPKEDRNQTFETGAEARTRTTAGRRWAATR